MRIPLRPPGLVAVSLLVSTVAAGLARPPAASAASPGTGSLAVDSGYSCALKDGQAYCWGAGTNSGVPIAAGAIGVLAGKTCTQIGLLAEASGERLIMSPASSMWPSGWGSVGWRDWRCDCGSTSGPGDGAAETARRRLPSSLR
jgi:hypothetical protein